MAGRTKRQFTDEEVRLIEEYARNNCYAETIANALNIPVRTLKRHFARKLTLWKAQGKIDLRLMQRDLAKKSPEMAKFLGKNELNQTDKQVIETKTAPVTAKTEAEQRALAEAARVFKLRIADSA